MGSVVSAINELGIDVEHIPGSCTGLCQPIDVRVGKPFKTRVQKAWEEWMLEKLEDGITAIPTPTRRDVTDWVLQSTAGFSGTNICYNSWGHGEKYSYFVAGSSSSDDDQCDYSHNSSTCLHSMDSSNGPSMKQQQRNQQ
jgi:hypothetical protein